MYFSGAKILWYTNVLITDRCTIMCKAIRVNKVQMKFSKVVYSANFNFKNTLCGGSSLAQYIAQCAPQCGFIFEHLALVLVLVQLSSCGFIFGKTINPSPELNLSAHCWLQSGMQ